MQMYLWNCVKTGSYWKTDAGSESPTCGRAEILQVAPSRPIHNDAFSKYQSLNTKDSLLSDLGKVKKQQEQQQETLPEQEQLSKL